MSDKDILDRFYPERFADAPFDLTKLYSEHQVLLMLQLARSKALNDVLKMLTDEWFKDQHEIERRIIEMAKEE